MQKDVAKAISNFGDRQSAEACARVEALARDLGYYMAELVGTKTKSSRAPVAAKYRHPENPALTWSDRGRKPQWFAEPIAFTGSVLNTIEPTLILAVAWQTSAKAEDAVAKFIDGHTPSQMTLIARLQ